MVARWSEQIVIPGGDAREPDDASGRPKHETKLETRLDEVGPNVLLSWDAVEQTDIYMSTSRLTREWRGGWARAGRRRGSDLIFGAEAASPGRFRAIIKLAS